MHTLKPVASSTLSLPTDNYIYTLTPSAPGTFAAISSDDSLRVFDTSLNASVISTTAHHGVTSLRSFGDSLLVTGGRDGKVKVWDVRAGKAVAEMQTREFIVAKLFVSFSGFRFEIFSPVGWMHALLHYRWTVTGSRGFSARIVGIEFVY
jgi:WD40 repeat protein